MERAKLIQAQYKREADALHHRETLAQVEQARRFAEGVMAWEAGFLPPPQEPLPPSMWHRAPSPVHHPPHPEYDPVIQAPVPVGSGGGYPGQMQHEPVWIDSHAQQAHREDRQDAQHFALHNYSTVDQVVNGPGFDPPPNHHQHGHVATAMAKINGGFYGPSWEPLAPPYHIGPA